MQVLRDADAARERVLRLGAQFFELRERFLLYSLGSRWSSAGCTRVVQQYAAKRPCQVSVERYRFFTGIGEHRHDGAMPPLNRHVPIPATPRLRTDNRFEAGARRAKRSARLLLCISAVRSRGECAEELDHWVQLTFGQRKQGRTPFHSGEWPVRCIRVSPTGKSTPLRG